MKRVIGVSVLAMLMAGMAQADTYTQTIDFRLSSNPYWNGSWDSSVNGKYITEGAYRFPTTWYANDPFNYQHNVTSVVGSGDTINSATLSLSFVDDDPATLFGRELVTEDVRLRFDNGSWIGLGEVDSGSKGPYNVLSALDDGILNVRVQLHGAPAFEDIYLKTSTLSLDYTPGSEPVPTPVPAAVLIGALGLGTAGLKLRRFA